MQVHIDRNGERYGPYSIEDINAYLANGTLLPTDLAWQDGMADWMPLSEFSGVGDPEMPVGAHTHTSLGQSPGKKKLFIGISATVGVCVIGVVVLLSMGKDEATSPEENNSAAGARTGEQKAGQSLSEFIKDKRIYIANNDEDLGIVYMIQQFNADGTFFNGVEHSGSMRIQRPEKVQQRYEVNGLVIKVVESQQGVEDKEYTITFQNIPIGEGDNLVFQSSDGESKKESVAKVTSGPF